MGKTNEENSMKILADVMNKRMRLFQNSIEDWF